jgi:hypothetical protein
MGDGVPGMSNIYEQCRSNLEVFEREFDPSALTRNEATTRLHLIDRLFFDCLA